MKLASQMALVFVGSGLGGSLRFGVYTLFSRLVPFARFPYATLAVNVVGCFLIAFITHVALTTTLVSANARLFLTVGVMGGLTTYSTFNHDLLSAVRSGQLVVAAANGVATFTICLAAGVLGTVCARALVQG